MRARVLTITIFISNIYRCASVRLASTATTATKATITTTTTTTKAKGFWNDVSNQKEALNSIILSKLPANDSNNNSNIVDSTGNLHSNILSSFNWNSLTTTDFKNAKLFGCVLQQYGGSISNIVSAIYPQVTKFPTFQARKRSQGYWDDVNRQKEVLNTVILSKLNITDLNDEPLIYKDNGLINNDIISKFDWSLLSMDDFKRISAHVLVINKFNRSVSRYILEYYPMAIHSHSFHKRRRFKGFWDVVDNQKQVLNYIILHKLNLIDDKSSSLNFTKYTDSSTGSINENLLSNFDWSSLTLNDFKQANATHLVRIYNNSISRLLLQFYPQASELQAFSNRKKPKGYWTSKDNIINYVKQVLEKEFQIKNTNDWYRISLDQLQQVGARGLLCHYSLYQILKMTYPDVKWNEALFSSKNKRSRQYWLKMQLHQIFTTNSLVDNDRSLNPIEIHEEYLHEELTRKSNANIEFDIFIPQLNLAFEYQGEHHYYENPTFASLELQTTRDREKQLLCNESNIKLISIPFWWNNKIESLLGTIKAEYGEIVVEKKDILSEEQSRKIENADPSNAIPPTFAAFSANTNSVRIARNTPVMLCSTWANSAYTMNVETKISSNNNYNSDGSSTDLLSEQNTIDPSGYLISEKYDGIRVFIQNGQVKSRANNVINTPPWWNQQLLQFSKNNPTLAFDGELWMGYNTIHKLNQILKLKDEATEDWKNTKIMIFDLIPTCEQQQSMPVEERINELSNQLASLNKEQFQLASFVKCKNRNHLLEELDKVSAKGGEGLVIRKPNSTYHFSRSPSMMKVKYVLDSEVKLLRKADNCIGFDCELPNGNIQTVRCKWTDYKNAPEKGSILTVQHYGITENTKKLKYPFYLRTRTDVQWDQLISAC